MVDMLLKQNADRNKENKEGLLPFEVAVKHRHWEAARAVLGGVSDACGAQQASRLVVER